MAREGKKFVTINFSEKIAKKLRHTHQDTFTILREYVHRLSMKMQKMKIGDCVYLPEIGTFTKVLTKERKSRNPATGENLLVPPREKIKFKQSRAIRIIGDRKPPKVIGAKKGDKIVKGVKKVKKVKKED